MPFNLADLTLRSSSNRRFKVLMAFGKSCLLTFSSFVGPHPDAKIKPSLLVVIRIIQLPAYDRLCRTWTDTSATQDTHHKESGHASRSVPRHHFFRHDEPCGG